MFKGTFIYGEGGQTGVYILTKEGEEDDGGNPVKPKFLIAAATKVLGDEGHTKMQDLLEYLHDIEVCLADLNMLCTFLGRKIIRSNQFYVPDEMEDHLIGRLEACLSPNDDKLEKNKVDKEALLTLLCAALECAVKKAEYEAAKHAEVSRASAQQGDYQALMERLEGYFQRNEATANKTAKNTEVTIQITRHTKRIAGTEKRVESVEGVD